MKPIECDVYCTRDLIIDNLIDYSLTINGNLYVDGDADFLGYDVEIFGDVFINKKLNATNFVVHGNLHCGILNCDTAEVDGDIFVSSINDSDTVISHNGNIYAESDINATTVVALEGSVIVNGIDDLASEISELKVFDEVDINGDLIYVTEIVAGAGIHVNGILHFDEADYFNNDYASISVLHGGIKSKNINI